MQRLLYIAYVILLAYIVWFIRTEPQDTIVINLIPFRTIRLFLVALLHGYAPLHIVLANILGNIALTIPLGMFLFRLLGSMKHFTLLFLAIYIPMHIESMQLFLHVVGYSSRTVDIDDVLLNGTGILIGYYILRWEKKRQARTF